MVALEDARRIIAAAEKKAREIGQPMNIAVADEGGNLIAHVRMDGAWLGSIDISIKKALSRGRIGLTSTKPYLKSSPWRAAKRKRIACHYKLNYLVTCRSFWEIESNCNKCFSI
jgi:uncharacterized protein GlcG (DUF336 family)